MIICIGKKKSIDIILLNILNDFLLKLFYKSILKIYKSIIKWNSFNSFR